MVFMAIASSRGLGGILVKLRSTRGCRFGNRLYWDYTSGVQGQLNRETGSGKLTREKLRKDRVLFARNALRRFGKDGGLA